MKILGISSNYHDASASLVVDGSVIASSAEERFTCQKHDPNFPRFSVEFCVEAAGIKNSDLDMVVYHEDPMSKFSRNLSSSFFKFPYSMGTFIKSSKEMILGGFFIKNTIAQNLNISPKKVKYIPHHMSHAAHAYLTSPFDDAAIITIDAVGEWSATCLFNGTKRSLGNDIELLDMNPFPHSLGLVYSAFTAFLGFKVNDGECSTMALAAFGEPSYTDQIRQIIKLSSNGYSIDLSYFDFSSDDKIPITSKFIELFGKPRSYKDNLSFDCLSNEQNTIADEKRFADIASSLQYVLEEAILRVAAYLYEISPQKNLCYAGGVSLNCVANSKLSKSGIFDNIYIPPDPGDGGGAMGAALYASMLFDEKNSSQNRVSVYMGESYDSKELEDLVPHLEFGEWHKYSSFKLPRLGNDSIYTKKIENDDDLFDFITDKIYENNIIGWFQGKFENGPRALGNRSLLCRPDSLDTVHRLSHRIKRRASFRPYALSVVPEYAREIFEEETPLKLDKWMQSSFKIKKDFRAVVRGAIHVDHTTRAQVCYEEDNHKFFGLLSRYYEKYNVGGLLNTSFNESGFPIVSTPLHALIMFARTDLDILVVGNYVISKKK